MGQYRPFNPVAGVASCPPIFMESCKLQAGDRVFLRGCTADYWGIVLPGNLFRIRQPFYMVQWNDGVVLHYAIGSLRVDPNPQRWFLFL